MSNQTQTQAIAIDNARKTEALPLNRTKVGMLLAEQAGKFVSIDFVKANGKQRTLTGRLGVRKHLAGGKPTVGLAHQEHVVLFDTQCMGYRAVNLSTVQRVRAEHSEYAIVG